MESRGKVLLTVFAGAVDAAMPAAAAAAFLCISTADSSDPNGEAVLDQRVAAAAAAGVEASAASRASSAA